MVVVVVVVLVVCVRVCVCVCARDLYVQMQHTLMHTPSATTTRAQIRTQGHFDTADVHQFLTHSSTLISLLHFCL